MVWLKRDTVIRPFPESPPAEPFEISATGTEAEATSKGIAELLDPLSRLRRLLEEGRFAPGSRLPPERTLAAQLGVGRPALREAIKSLCATNVLASRRGSGTYVKSLGVPAQHPPLAIELSQAELKVLDLLEARKMLEPRTAWLAATRADEQDLRDIETARQRLQEHAADWRFLFKLDGELHAAIIRGARNPVLDLMGRMLLAKSEPRDGNGSFSPDVRRMIREHNAVVDAILKRQPDAAERAMTEHLNSVGLDYLAEGGR